jgi:hypothetical protein
MYRNDDWDVEASALPDMADAPAEAADFEPTAPAEAAPAEAARPDLRASFLAGIATAMRATAIQERQRIAAAVADSTIAHEQKVRDRGAAEATELRRLADDDIAGIEKTAAEEIERIRTEAERRVGDRRAELSDHLERHAALIQTEIGRIQGAVDDYHAELDGFFGRLADEENPAEIARLAGLLPEPPDLDQVGANARADAVNQIADEAAGGEPEAAGIEPEAETAASPAEPAVVGVMAAEPGTPVFADAPEPADTDADAVPAGGIEDSVPVDEATEPASANGTGISAAKLLRNLAPWTNSDRSEDSSD